MNILHGTNWLGLYTLTRKEIARFMKVHVQTVSAPVLTAVLYYLVFAVALGDNLKTMAGVPFLAFLAPGLIMMTMMQNAFNNSSSSLVIAKIQGHMTDFLLPPLSHGEFLTGFMAGGVARAVVVGVASAVTLWLLLDLSVAHMWAVVVYGLLGSMLLSVVGVLCGIWAEKFDQVAAVQNFFIVPGTFLSGTFYTADQLPPHWQFICHLNPFFYMIDGFRYGFIGVSDGTLMTGFVYLLVLNVAMLGLAYYWLHTGYRLRG
ncbi:MAG: multidrug ABC transporter permease [Alphaproteobacteria bacterium]|nr:multidrug ABC transporter permease [Alphaproteobacteria bacterium]